MSLASSRYGTPLGFVVGDIGLFWRVTRVAAARQPFAMMQNPVGVRRPLGVIFGCLILVAIFCTLINLPSLFHPIVIALHEPQRGSDP